MYQLINAVIRPYDSSRPISTVIVNDLNIRSLIVSNKECYLILTNDVLDGEHVLNIKDVIEDVFKKDPDLTVDQWLSTLGNKSLPTSINELRIEEGRVRSVDAFQAGYNISPSSGRRMMDDDNLIQEDLVDLAIYKDDFNHIELGKSMLTSVGGYLHLTDYDDMGIYVKQGNLTANKYTSLKTNLISFAGVGGLELVPLSECNKIASDGVFKFNGVDIVSPSSLSNKTVYLSIAGHLMTKVDDYKISGDKTINLNISNLLLLEKYVLMRDILDTTSIDLLVDRGAKDILLKEDFKSDEVIDAFLNLSQSFIIIVDNSSVTTELVRVEEAGPIGKYFIYGSPSKLIVTGDMRLPPKYTTLEDKCHVLSTSIENGLVPNYYQIRSSLEEEVFINHLLDNRNRVKTPIYDLNITSTKLILD